MRARTRKNTRFVITLFSAVLLLLLLVMASASAAEGPAVMITDYTVEPGVLMPGDTGTITITIENMDILSSETEIKTSQDLLTTTTTVATVSAEIDSIRLSSTTRDIEWRSEGYKRTEYYNVGTLGPGESMKIVIPIKAAAYAHDGTYFPEVYIEVDNGKNVRFPVRVKVDSSSVEILEKDIPSEISLSESKEIAIVVANNRPNPVSGVDVRVKSESDGLEFMPERIFIGDLEAYGKKEMNFILQTQTFKESLIGNKEFSFEVAYKNGDNEHHSAFTSSVLVKSTADVRLILVNAPEFVFEGDIARIDFDVANGMAKDIKAVSVVPAIEGLRILPSEYFIGDMEVGDVFSASFDVYTSDLSLGETTIPFTVVFKDVDTDKQYEMQGYEVHVEVREPQKSELPSPGLLGALVVILLLVAVVVGVRIKRRRGRREKK